MKYMAIFLALFMLAAAPAHANGNGRDGCPPGHENIESCEDGGNGNGGGEGNGGTNTNTNDNTNRNNNDNTNTNQQGQQQGQAQGQIQGQIATGGAGGDGGDGYGVGVGIGEGGDATATGGNSDATGVNVGGAFNDVLSPESNSNSEADADSTAISGSHSGVYGSGNSDTDVDVDNTNVNLADGGNAAIIIGGAGQGGECYEGECEGGGNGAFSNESNVDASSENDNSNQVANDVEVNVEGDDIVYEAAAIPVNSAPPSFSAICSSGGAGSGKSFSLSLAVTNDVCQALMVADAYAAMGDMEEALKWVNAAARHAKWKGGMGYFRHVITLGVM